MRNTAIESEKKLTKSLGHDFWTFYLENKKIIDKILIKAAAPTNHIIPVDEMVNELLCKLHHMGFLSRYNSKLNTRWNTYMTHLARGYARHILNEHSLQKGYSLRAKSNQPFKDQVLFSNINHTEVGTRVSLPSSDFLDELICKDLQEELRKRLSPTLVKVFDLMLEDKTHKEIGKILEVSGQYVSNCSIRIRKKLTHFTNKEIKV